MLDLKKQTDKTYGDQVCGLTTSYHYTVIKKKKKTDNNTGEDVEKLEQLYIAGRNVMQCSHFGK